MASPSSNVLSHTFWCWCSTCLIISWLQISHCSWRTLWCLSGPKTRPWFLGKAGFKEDLPFIYIESYPEILIIVQVNPWHNFCPFHVLFLNLNVDSSTVILSSMPLAKVRQSYLFENHSFTSKISLVRIWQLRYWGRISEIHCESIFARSRGLRSLDEAGNLTFFSVPGGQKLPIQSFLFCFFEIFTHTSGCPS